MTIELTHAAAAELLFGAGPLPASTVAAARMIAAEYRRRHGDLNGAAAEMAQAFGDHPDTAAARMRACLAVAPRRVELPDSYGPAWLHGDDPADLLAEALLCESAGYDGTEDDRG